MKYPDAVTIRRQSTPDEYGNPGWDTPTEIPAQGFLQHAMIFLPPTVDIRAGDRLVTARGLFQVDGEPELMRSPARPILWQVRIARIPGV